MARAREGSRGCGGAGRLDGDLGRRDVPGILNWAEMYDIAGLIAPRPLFAESGERDNIFPVEASRASFARERLGG